MVRKRPVTVSVFDYPEHLNPFREEEELERLAAQAALEGRTTRCHLLPLSPYSTLGRSPRGHPDRSPASPVNGTLRRRNKRRAPPPPPTAASPLSLPASPPLSPEGLPPAGREGPDSSSLTENATTTAARSEPAAGTELRETAEAPRPTPRRLVFPEEERPRPDGAAEAAEEAILGDQQEVEAGPGNQQGAPDQQSSPQETSEPQANERLSTELTREDTNLDVENNNTNLEVESKSGEENKEIVILALPDENTKPSPEQLENNKQNGCLTEDKLVSTEGTLPYIDQDAVPPATQEVPNAEDVALQNGDKLPNGYAHPVIENSKLQNGHLEAEEIKPLTPQCSDNPVMPIVDNQDQVTSPLRTETAMALENQDQVTSPVPTETMTSLKNQDQETLPVPTETVTSLENQEALPMPTETLQHDSESEKIVTSRQTPERGVQSETSEEELTSSPTSDAPNKALESTEIEKEVVLSKSPEPSLPVIESNTTLPKTESPKTESPKIRPTTDKYATQVSHIEIKITDITEV